MYGLDGSFKGCFGRIYQFRVPGQVHCDGCIGNVSIDMHTDIQFDHILAEYSSIFLFRSGMGSLIIAGYIYWKCRLTPFFTDHVLAEVCHIKQGRTHLNLFCGLFPDMGKYLTGCCVFLYNFLDFLDQLVFVHY